MKTIVAALFAALLLPVGVASARHAHPRHPARHQVTLHEEIELSPGLMKQLQANLAAAGYLDGSFDGHLNRRTHRALAAFQRDYHMNPTGTLDFATARALLGAETLSAYLVARQ